MKVLVFIFSILAITVSLWPESVDDLFVAPLADLTAVPNPSPIPSSVPAVAAVPAPQVVNVYWSSSNYGGVLVGSNNYIPSPNATAFYSMAGTATVDARPAPQFHFEASMSTTSTPGGIPTPTFTEYFIDYTLAQNYLLRAGKQSMSWGQGRLFDFIDLSAGVGSGNSLQLAAPLFGQSFTGVILIESILNPAAPSYRDMHFLAQYSGDIGPIGWGVAGRAQRGYEILWAEQIGSGFLKTNLWGVDLFTQAEWNQGLVTELAGFYWESKDLNVKVQYEVNNMEMGIAAKAIDGVLKPGIKWTNYSADNSGIIVPGLEWTIDSFLVIDFGFPIVYGPLNGVVTTDSDYPYGMRYGFGVKLNVNANF